MTEQRCLKPGCAKARGTICQHALCHGRGYGGHIYPQGFDGDNRSEWLGKSIDAIDDMDEAALTRSTGDA